MLSDLRHARGKVQMPPESRCGGGISKKQVVSWCSNSSGQSSRRSGARVALTAGTPQELSDLLGTLVVWGSFLQEGCSVICERDGSACAETGCCRIGADSARSCGTSSRNESEVKRGAERPFCRPPGATQAAQLFHASCSPHLRQTEPVAPRFWV